DYRPRDAAPHKIKKNAEEMALQLVRNPDILATMAAQDPRPFCVGFAAETENLAGNARAKLAAKRLDLIFANDATTTFDSEEAAAPATQASGAAPLGQGGKEGRARDMVRVLAARRGRA